MDAVGIKHIRGSEVVVFCGTLTATYLILKLLRFKEKKKKNYPPSIGCLPIVGSLPYLPTDFHELHRWGLEKTYELGGVFMFKVGSVYTVLLTSHEAIREAFVQRSTDFADRPDHFAQPILNPKGKGLVTHPYDEEYKKTHQISLSILKQFGFGRNLLETKINTEVEDLITSIKSLNGQMIDPKEMIVCSVQRIISSMLYGEPMDPDDQYDKLFMKRMGEMFDHFVSLFILDILPSLRFLPLFRRRINEATACSNKVLDLVERKFERILRPDADESFVSCYIEREGKNYDRLQLKSTVRDLVAAGTDTISTTMLWAVLLLANHPEVQKRLQKDIDSAVQRDRQPSLSEASKMTYVEATILELMRCKTALPIGVPRGTLRDTEVGGYFVPKDAHVFSVLYAAHMNVNVWGDPAEFRPERFLDADGKIINKDLVINFSIGKRSCLGELMARQEVYLFLTGLVQQFNILPPEGSDNIEYTEHVDIVLAPSPYKVRFLPRE